MKGNGIDPLMRVLDDTFGTDTAYDAACGPYIDVADLMHATMPLVASGKRMTDTIEQMTAGRFGCVGVVDSFGKLVGIITDGDLRRHMDEGLLGRTAADVMTWNPVTVERGMGLQRSLELMNSKKITVLFVVDDDHKPLGLVHLHDLIAAGA
jgi:arabinose-5-phosphate isomerase